MTDIHVAVIGVGNCCSSLLQGLYFYASDNAASPGLSHRNLASYVPGDIKLVAAFDIDRRKVGRDISEAIFAPPNSAAVFYADVPLQGVSVQMGPVMDGFSDHMREYDDQKTFVPADQVEPTMEQVVDILKKTNTHVLLNYLPVGSERATRFYAECALNAGVAFINCIPVFIASDDDWALRFERAQVPIIGDDVKSQIGATIIHRALTDLFSKRGVHLSRTYQINTGGNTDFLNMLNRDRLAAKKISKTEAVQSVAASRLEDDNIHIGPSDYVAWQKDNKVCFMRMEGELFGQTPVNLELRLSVEDSPNSAGVVIDMIRCAKLALDQGQGGVLHAPSACFCKHPPVQYSDDEAHKLLEAFVATARANEHSLAHEA